MGPLLELFAVQQLAAQATWTDADLRLWRYRDHHGAEADAVLNRGQDAWGVKVEASTRAGDGDGRGLPRLAADCGGNFRGGVVLYAGDSMLPLGGGRVLSVPMRELWERCPRLSPRVWETSDADNILTLLIRFIPACVGNMTFPAPSRAGESVHPRVCGEHPGTWNCTGTGCGSSPRVWGTSV